MGGHDGRKSAEERDGDRREERVEQAGRGGEEESWLNSLKEVTDAEVTAPRTGGQLRRGGLQAACGECRKCGRGQIHTPLFLMNELIATCEALGG